MRSPLASSSEPAFEVLLEPEREAIRVYPVGELDMATVRTLDEQLHGLVASGFMRVILDLRRLQFIDSSGLHLVITWHERAQCEGWDLSLVQGPPAIRRVFELTATLERLHFVTPAGRPCRVGDRPS